MSSSIASYMCRTCKGRLGECVCAERGWDAELIEAVDLECLECGKVTPVPIDDVNVKVAGLNYFCPDKDCEDVYASKQ